MATSNVEQRSPTIEQKKKLVDFIDDNTKIVSISSTKEEKELLWKNLIKELDNCGPSKSMEYWKRFWKDWKKKVVTKDEETLTMIDLRLKALLPILEKDSIETLTRDEVQECMKNIEREEADNNVRIGVLTNIIKETKDQIKQIKNKNDHLKKQKDRMINRLKKIEESE